MIRENTTIKHHGLIYKSDLIIAFLEGRKTQTRRIMTRFNTNVDGHGRASKDLWEQLDFNDAHLDSGPSPAGNPGPYLKVFNPITKTRHRIYPVYQAGDLMWARETWTEVLTRPFDNDSAKVIFRADGWESKDPDYPGLTYHSPIHLKKKDARIWREITKVRIQRIQEISIGDIMAEGLTFDQIQDTIQSGQNANDEIRKRFISLWDGINAKRGYPWEANDWVIALNLESGNYSEK